MAVRCPCLCLAPWTPPLSCHTAPPPPSHRLNKAFGQSQAAAEQAFPAVLARPWHPHPMTVLQLQAQAAGNLTPCARLRVYAIAAQSARARRQPGRQAAALAQALAGLISVKSASWLALLQRPAMWTILRMRTSWRWRPSSSMKTLASLQTAWSIGAPACINAPALECCKTIQAAAHVLHADDLIALEV